MARERAVVVGESPAGPRPFLFVHGAWHGPWCWQEHWAGYFRDAGHHVEAIQLGAHDRPGNHSRIWTTIPRHVTEVLAGHGLATPDAVPGRSRSLRDPYDSLTPGERRCVRLAQRGLTNAVIADSLGLSVRTVENNLSRAFGKLGVRSRVELALLDESASSP